MAIAAKPFPKPDLVAIEAEIARSRAYLRFLEGQRDELSRKESIEVYSREAIQISQGLDEWIGKAPIDPHPDRAAKALFLGACSGEWAARSRYRGDLPGFGGFLLCLGGKRILVDPGNQTFSALLSQSYHPSHLDYVIATHSHWDCVRDLDLILMAANPVSGKSKSGPQLELLADKSVIFGTAMNVDAVLESPSTKTVVDESQRKRLDEFPFVNPAVVSVYDLFVRLRGRFRAIEIDQRYELAPNLQLYTRRSHHSVDWGRKFIPALDFVLRDGLTRIRCVYLSDTEYRPDLAEQYRADLETLGPIDLLICNVKTLDVFPYEKGDLTGFTRKHLGWQGVVRLTKDMQRTGVLSSESLVVLRAWGLETVTELNATDHAMVARPDKLEMYEQWFGDATGQPCVVPGVTWVAAGENRAPAVVHRRPPFLAQGDIRTFGGLYYISQAMDAVIRQARALTDSTEANVLIKGETGTGKDVLAKAIHDEGSQPGKFVSHNASELTNSMPESLLFGYTKGAFTGADADKKGWLEAASGGTLLIQEFAEMPVENQKLFLKVLQERRFHSLGSSLEIPFDGRFIATTNLLIDEAMRSGRLREDLFRRFAFVITMPPLRERLEDIPAILAGWRRDRAEEVELPGDLNPDIVRLLQRYDWPGNVRQMKNVLKTIAASGDWSAENVRLEVERAHPLHRGMAGEKRVSGEWDETDRTILALLGKGEPMSRKSLQASLPELTGAKLIYHLGKLTRARMVKQVGAAKNTMYALV